MLEGKRIIVVMPTYNAEKTIEKTFSEIPKNIVDEVVIVDDCSKDRTVEIAKQLNAELIVHQKNRGYGANQKTGYKEALKKNADIVVMLHADYQYSPKFITAMAGLLCSGLFDIILGSRILGGYALKGGMPLYKYISNRILTLIENVILGAKLSEYHTGYRAFTREALKSLPLLENSDDFVFDNQILAQAIYSGYRIGEISTPSAYTSESSTINFKRSVVYGFGVLTTALKFMLQRMKLAKFALFDPAGAKLPG